MIKFNNKDIDPKFNNENVSKVMFNGKQIYPSVTFEPYTLQNVPNGVYIIDTDNLLYPRANWDTANNANAMGVAVISDNCRFAISKQEAPDAMTWGSTGTPAGCFMSYDESAALQDFAGEANTDAVIAAYGENANAAYYCWNAEGLFPDGRQGYLPSFGELRTVYDNKSEVVACMSLIGGAAFRNSYYWSSSLYDRVRLLD